MGLLGRVFNNGLPGKQSCRHHNIHGSAHACHIQGDSGPVKALFRGLQSHIVLRLVHIRAQGQEALDMLVDGTGGKIAAAGQRHMGMAEPAKQGPHQIVAGPHLLDKLRVWSGALHL